MKRKLLLFILRSFLVSSGYAQGVRLPVVLEGQQHDNWCWAASLSMAIKYYIPAQRANTQLQCQLVTDKISPSPATAASCKCCEMPKKNDKCTFIKTPNGPCLPCTLPLPVSYNPNGSPNWSETIGIVDRLLRLYGLRTDIIKVGRGALATIKARLAVNDLILGIYAGGGYHVSLISGYEVVAGETLLFVNNPLYQPKATCTGCFHVIKTNAKGENALAISEYAGTYTSQLFIVIHKP